MVWQPLKIIHCLEHKYFGSNLKTHSIWCDYTFYVQKNAGPFYEKEKCVYYIISSEETISQSISKIKVTVSLRKPMFFNAMMLKNPQTFSPHFSSQHCTNPLRSHLIDNCQKLYINIPCTEFISDRAVV